MDISTLNSSLEATRLFGHLDKEFLNEFVKYEKIVLRGAGFFGSEIGKQLIQHGIPANKIQYWDVRAQELQYVNGIEVVMPYISSQNTDDILVIHCIPNGSLSGSSILKELKNAGFRNILDGMALFEAAFCEMDLEKGFDAEVCLNTKVCNWDACDRLMNFVERDCKNPKYTEKELLSFQVIAFVLSLRCSLNCTHCGQYINTLAKRDMAHHIPVEQVIKDIDTFFDAIDTVAFVSVIGGEAFLHPDFDRIISKILEKQNFGVLGITTNGMCKITQKHLEVLKNNRTRVIFSDYTMVLTPQQKKLFDENVRKVAEFGIHYTVGQPVWTTPPTLKSQDFSLAHMTAMKAGCNSVKTCQTVQNGKLYPCGVTPYVDQLGVIEEFSDYIDLDGVDIRPKIKNLHAQSHYQSCNNCAGGGEHLDYAGRQGYDNRYDHLLEGINIVDLR